MNKTLRQLNDRVEDLGLQPGSPEYERALRAVKVERCREMQGVGVCSDCKAYDYCELTKQHMRDRVFRIRT